MGTGRGTRMIKARPLKKEDLEKYTAPVYSDGTWAGNDPWIDSKDVENALQGLKREISSEVLIAKDTKMALLMAIDEWFPVFKGEYVTPGSGVDYRGLEDVKPKHFIPRIMGNNTNYRNVPKSTDSVEDVKLAEWLHKKFLFNQELFDVCPSYNEDRKAFVLVAKELLKKQHKQI